MSAHESSLRTIATLILAVAVVTSGCLAPAGQEADDSTAPTTIEKRPATNDTDTRSSEENTTTNTTEPTNETSANRTAEPPGERTVQHAMGSTTIQGETTRIVALEWNFVEASLALDIQPVGVANPDGYRKWVAAGGLSENVTDVGTRAEPSLETIANLEPDLILGIQFRHEDIYDELSEIAPTLVFEGFPGENDSHDQYDRMISIFERIGKATAHPDRVDGVLTDLQETYDKSRARLEEAGMADREILLTQLFTYQGQPLARTFIDGSIPDRVAEAIGLTNAWTKTGCSTGYGYCDVNKEGFADVQHADFFYQAQPEDDPVKDEWQDDPVWNSYDFVKEDRVYALGSDAWMFGGPLVVERIAERIVDHQVG